MLYNGEGGGTCEFCELQEVPEPSKFPLLPESHEPPSCLQEKSHFRGDDYPSIDTSDIGGTAVYKEVTKQLPLKILWDVGTLPLLPTLEAALPTWLYFPGFILTLTAGPF